MDRPQMGGAEPSSEPQPGRRDWLGLWVLATALAMIVLDGTIVGVALPQIIRDLHLSLPDAQWVNSLYSVVFAALLLTSGRLGDRFGRRRMLRIGVTVFLAGSVLAAVAGGAGALIAARAGQGVGGAMILPSTLSTVNATFRGRSRAAAFGVWGAVMSGAAAIGPLLGGWLTHVAAWPWIFWVNLPIGIGVLLATQAVVPETRNGDDGSALDLPGPVLSAVGFGLVVFGLIEGPSLGWWKPLSSFTLPGLTWSEDAPVSVVPVALGLGAVVVAAFLAWEARMLRRSLAPVLDLRLFRIPTFSWGNITAMLVAVGEFSLIFILPLYLVTSLRLSTLGAGYVLASMALGAFVAGAMARHLAARFGAATVVIIGLALEVLGAVGTALATHASAGGWAVAETLLPYGIGLGLASAQLTSTVLRDVPVAESGTGSAIQSTVRQLGAALGSALGGTALSASLGSTTHFTDAATFASAASASVWVSTAALFLGLLAALQVRRAAV